MNTLGLLVAGGTALLVGVTAQTVPRPVDASTIEDVIVRQKGKVVLLNFWATWCPPCTREFPELVEVEKHYRDRGVVVISVSADFPEKVHTQLMPFLAKHRPGFEVYILETRDLKELTHALDPEWKGTIPATFFFDRRGKPSVKRYSEMNRQEMERILKALLDDPPPP
jgi:thiol-disulfide isomerase/thioredoxin